MSPKDKVLVWFAGEVKTPPFSSDACQTGIPLCDQRERAHVDDDAIVIVDVFAKKTNKTPDAVI